MAQDSSNRPIALDDDVECRFTRRELRDVELSLRTRVDVELDGPRQRGLMLLADRVKAMRA